MHGVMVTHWCESGTWFEATSHTLSILSCPIIERGGIMKTEDEVQMEIFIDNLTEEEAAIMVAHIEKIAKEHVAKTDLKIVEHSEKE